jgi:hypothetical protein
MKKDKRLTPVLNENDRARLYQIVNKLVRSNQTQYKGGAANLDSTSMSDALLLTRNKWEYRHLYDKLYEQTYYVYEDE